MNTSNHGKVTYGPMLQKTYSSALNAFLEKEIPSAGGPLVRELLVKNLVDITEQYFPDTEKMRPGQIQWAAVKKDANVRKGATMRDTPQKSLILDLVPPSVVPDRINGRSIIKIRKEAIVRLFRQADQQGGCLTSADVAVLLNLSDHDVCRYIKEIETETGQWLPRRGTIHDLGPTLSHKKGIIRRWLLERKTVQQIVRETDHRPQSISRYINSFQRVILCFRKGLTPKETSTTLRMSLRLVMDYWDLIQTFNQGGAIDALIQNE